MFYPISPRCCMAISVIMSAMLLIIEAASAVSALNMKTAPNTTKTGCPRQCGNVTVPYPFGIGLETGCSLSPWYDIFCDTSYDPPRAFSPFTITSGNDTMIEVLDISDAQFHIRNPIVSYTCYNSTGHITSKGSEFSIQLITKAGAPYSLSPTDNLLTVVGCEDTGSISGAKRGAFEDVFLQNAGMSCSSHCSKQEDVSAGNCTGTNGCCQAKIPQGSWYFSFGTGSAIGSDNNHSSIASWNPCGYAFIAAEGYFAFRGASDLNDSTFVDRIMDSVPIVLDWVISNQSCSQAQQNSMTYACGRPNSFCIDGGAPTIGGYRCICKPGYQGNPYLDDGCTDIDECAAEQIRSQCSWRCHNSPGGYKCSCPPGYSGDGKTDGTGCFPAVPVALGTVFGFTLLTVCLVWLWRKMKEKMLRKRRDKFFQQNGGNLLKQLLSSGNGESANIFTMKELLAATKNFSEDCIIGKGGCGMVYKGILPGNQVVAIKKSKVIDESQIEQFINELVILTRTNHPNVVKLLGCCLEDEVPLLVYEFVPNGTLYDHIQTQGGASWLSWSNCLFIATESAKALAYLHSIPIVHRDIKSTNILLDDNNRAKISDFGISRLIPMGRTRLSTLVHGTLGYLDPEYFLSSHLTSKSDVYSFGVVLAELLTRKAAIFTDERDLEERNLSVYFLKHMEAGRLNEILDLQLGKEASQDQLLALGNLIQRCLRPKGKERPTMTEVVMVLEELCKLQEYQGN